MQNLLCHPSKALLVASLSPHDDDSINRLLSCRNSHSSLLVVNSHGSLIKVIYKVTSFNSSKSFITLFGQRHHFMNEKFQRPAFRTMIRPLQGQESARAYALSIISSKNIVKIKKYLKTKLISCRRCWLNFVKSLSSQYEFLITVNLQHPRVNSVIDHI